MMLFSAGIFLIFLNNFLAPVSACIEPQGIGNGPSDTYNSTDLAAIPRGFVIALYAQLGLVRSFASEETPIQTRHSLLDSFVFFNIAGLYEPAALDIWARKNLTNSRRFCALGPNATETEVSDRELHRTAALAYGIYYTFLDRENDEAIQAWKDAMTGWGLDADICDSLDCDSSTATPWALGKAIEEEVFLYELGDGWNRNGDYDREYNQIPFSDFRHEDTRYEPQNRPWRLEELDRWQPLLEDDRLGFLFYQEHVTPHIGFTGKSVFFTDEEICAREAPEPEYDYDLEIELLFGRLANLTDLQKMEIEEFDQKFNLAFLTFQKEFFGRGNVIDSWEYITSYTVEQVVLYEAVLAVWKEKIIYDLVRPTSIVQTLLRDTLITTYAGTTADGASLGTQTFLADDFEPYIRTMPHSEYPSATACMCAAFASSKTEFYGADEFSPPVSFRFQPFSSSNEPLSTPDTLLVASYSSYTQISDRCSQTRLEGGMHFTTSVPAGEDLCAPIGPRVAQSILALMEGEAPEYVVPYDTDVNSFRERTECYRNVRSDAPTAVPTGAPVNPGEPSFREIEYNANPCVSTRCSDPSESEFCARRFFGGGCKQCQEDYFRRSNFYPCVECDIIPFCLECDSNGWSGCRTCADGTVRRWDREYNYFRCF